MKLLFDENISCRIKKLVDKHFPNSIHVSDIKKSLITDMEIWKYAKQLSALGIIEAKPSSTGQRGKTTLIGLHQIPALELEKEISLLLEKSLKEKNNWK